eukprot:CAMPEP_0119029200 /NCGR_PEP_ID=MMETSP1176-20130426/40320_1 /TAXON_ID=265551 /ORGANISM="Synedropsis recta cf, Strain CCMP1620" /LENGTH=300 /DNA_ID=CAMNT_0006985513 /DNA_START=19 /DNA_END=917 /DNA_ORIENTATION=-
MADDAPPTDTRPEDTPPVGGGDDSAQNGGAPPADDHGVGNGDVGGEDAAAAPPKPDDSAGGGGGGGGIGEEVKLYVGNLDYATDEQRLRDEFGQFGTVTDVFLPMERGTQRPRGFGFVTLSSRESSERAITKMDQAQLDGRTIRVNESRPKGERAPGGAAPGGRGPGGAVGFNAAGKEDVKLYVGNLAFDTPEEQVRQLFEQYGKVVDCFLPTDRDTGKPRGFAFVTMPSADAEQACSKLSGYEVDGRALRVNEAQPKGSSGGGGGRGGYGGGGGYDGGGGGYGGGYGGGGGGGYGGGGG